MLPALRKWRIYDAGLVFFQICLPFEPEELQQARKFGT
jgi:hypothetical protein